MNQLAFDRYSPPSADHEGLPEVYDTLRVNRGWGTAAGEQTANRTYWDPELLTAIIDVERETREWLEQNGIIVQEEYQPENLLSLSAIPLRAGVDRAKLMGSLSEIAPQIRLIPEWSVDAFQERMAQSKKNGDPLPLPAVLYHKESSHGANKYLIESEEQHKIADAWHRAWVAYKEPLLKEDFVFRQFIRTPSDRATSYRIVVTGAGDIIGSALLYSRDYSDADADKYITSDLPPEDLGICSSLHTEWLEVPASPFYLHSRQFTSNVAQGGGCIPLNPNEYSRPITPEEQEILRQHGIENQQLPEPLAEAAKAIGKYCRRALTAVDIIQDTDGNYYFLEENQMPGVQTISEVWNYGRDDTAAAYRIMLRKAMESIFPSLTDPEARRRLMV